MSKFLSQQVKLILKYLDGTIENDELAWLEQWRRASGDHEDFFQKMTKEGYLLEAVKESYQVRKDIDLKIQEKINLKEGGSLGSKIIAIGWKWMSAAAVFLLLFIAGTYYFFKQDGPSKTVTVSTAPIADVSAPTASRAVIKLSTGDVIYLDSVGTGTLFNNKNVEVVKQAKDVILFTGSGNNDAEGLKYNTVSNPRGSNVINIMLPDQSRVWLNSESVLQFPSAFNGNERRVTISGECYISVSKNASKPFFVSIASASGDKMGEIRVTGTEFNIMAYDGEPEIKVTVVEGHIKISPGAGKAGEKDLDAGKQARLKGENVTAIEKANISQALAWKNGFFDVEHATIKDIFRMASRHYDIKTEYVGSIDERGTYTGTFSRDLSLINLMNVLQFTGINCRLEETVTETGKTTKLIISSSKKSN